MPNVGGASCYIYGMTGKQFRFCLACLLLWPVGAFVSDRLIDVISPLVWWCFHQPGATALSPQQFGLAAFLPLATAMGFALGLVPKHQVRLWGQSLLGRFRNAPAETGESETDDGHPILWAWTIPAILFAVRWILFGVGRDHSVLGDGGETIGRFEYFFGRLNAEKLVSAPNPQAASMWLYDRIFLTEPMLFLAAYAGGVSVRHRFEPKNALQIQEEPNAISTDTLGS
jgi:hypothetical protein